MKKMPKTCGIDGVMMPQMNQISEKNIPSNLIFIPVFQKLYAKDRGMVIVFPFRLALNSPFTKGSHPARYCHCVPRINRDSSFPLSSYSVGTTENSSGMVSLFSPSSIVTGTLSTVPREWDLLATP